MSLPIHFAPLQGYTDAIYRQAHARIFGGVDAYYAPFTRVEHGEIRRKDMRDILPEANQGLRLIPQLIAPTAEKAQIIMDLFKQHRYSDIDINLGCPFPLLAKRHNGAGILPYPDEVKALLTPLVEQNPDIRFSVKLRLGWNDANECMALLPFLNELPLTHLVLHPRLGKQQYKGTPDMEAFTAFYEQCKHPLYYNGDVLTVDDIERVVTHYPRLSGIVIGRGLLANPALAAEYKNDTKLSAETLAAQVGRLHSEVFSAYEESLQGGETQLLMKMKSFWEYLLPDADRKARKVIHKTSKLANYQAAVSNLLGSM